jgi:hypothetical protein
MSMPVDTRASAPITYLTDVEGMWSKLASFAQGNPLVSLDDAGHLHVADGAVFAFGGDAIDRGPDGRRVVATLLAAKRRQPERIVLLAGNRDLNKLRLPRELGGAPPPHTPEEVRSGPRPALLRWIFQNTMGASDAFDFRRAELARERGAAPDEVAEADVVDSYLADLGPGGALRAYLAESQLTYRSGRTLFVHGGLSKENLGYVPDHAPPPTPGELDVDVDAWIARLNGWYRAQMDADGSPAWQPLIAYQAPLRGSKHNPGSVVYSRCVDDHNNLRLPAAPVIAALARAGITRAVVGHTPSGDSPSVGRHGSFQVICADNSHARHDQGSRVWIDDAELRIDARTRLDGDAPDAPLRRVRLALSATLGPDSPVGLRTREHGRLVRGVLDDGTFVTYRALPSWKTEQLAAPRDTLPPEALESPT